MRSRNSALRKSFRSMGRESSSVLCSRPRHRLSLKSQDTVARAKLGCVLIFFRAASCFGMTVVCYVNGLQRVVKLGVRVHGHIEPSDGRMSVMQLAFGRPRCFG